SCCAWTVRSAAFRRLSNTCSNMIGPSQGLSQRGSMPAAGPRWGSPGPLAMPATQSPGGKFARLWYSARGRGPRQEVLLHLQQRIQNSIWHENLANQENNGENAAFAQILL